MTRIEAFEILGFRAHQPPSQDEIKKAYRAGAMRWHPDRRQNHSRKEEATENFQKLQEAFDLLSGK